MAAIVGGMASSHAYAFDDIEEWEQRREKTRNNYARRYGKLPDEAPEVQSESIEGNRERFRDIVDGFQRIERAVDDLNVDAIILIGDDQDENFTELLPQFAIYTGNDYEFFDKREGAGGTQAAAPELASFLADEFVAADYDVSFCKDLPGGKLVSHAHTPLLHRLGTAARSIPVVPVFVNAIHVPAPSPARCYDFGTKLAAAVKKWPGDERIALYASGGLSHFTAGYPWAHYDGDATVGSICVEFDDELIDAMRSGRGEDLRSLSSEDLLKNGDIEFRQWLVMLGALGPLKPDFLHYHAFHRAVTGMAVGLWTTGQ